MSKPKASKNGLQKAKELKANLSDSDKALIAEIAKRVDDELGFACFIGNIESELAWCFHHIKAVLAENKT